MRRILMALHDLLGTSEMMAYLAMMTPRLLQMHRVLKATGSLYLHCDPSASHYLKIILDGIFSASGYRNEIVWKRTPFAGSSKARAGQFPRSHDTLFFYTKGKTWTWNRPSTPYSGEYLARFKWDDHDDRGLYRKTLLKTYSEETFSRLQREDRLIEPIRVGAMYSYKQYLSESSGSTQIDDVWTDINALNPVARERLGYPTQKPLALLKRIIEASTNPGDVVLDPFCGCGTAIDAAQELERQWIGIDVTHLAVEVIKSRLVGRYNLSPVSGYELVGEPRDIEGARKLAEHNKDQFELWALRQIGALPWEGKQKKGADKGRDGALVWRDTEEHAPRHAVVSVKGGMNVHADAVRDLIGTMHTESTEMGILLTLKKPTKAMLEAAGEAGMYQPKFSEEQVRRVQIICVEDLLAGTAKVRLPQGSLVISQKLPVRAVMPKPAQKALTLLTKVPISKDEGTAEEVETMKLSKAGAKRKATA